MIVKQFTDEKYVAMSDIANLDSDIVNEIATYRKNYIEMVEVNDLDFVNLVETPQLVKKRFNKNIDLKGKIKIDFKSNDFILEIAKLIVEGKEVPGVSIGNKEALLKKYFENKKDLTIVTNYLINHIEAKVVEDKGNIDKSYPELSPGDIEFIKSNNDINLSYSIADYQQMRNTSYETGRKALEKMEHLQFYKKTKVGKKFVYKPTEKLQAIMKGSE